MLNKYYQSELSRLRDLGAEFAKNHPALAPLLAGPSADPDTERILEGTAFLTGLLQQRLDDDFPEIIQRLFHLVFPHYLRPLPSAAMIQFTPKRSLMERLTVPRGAALDSVSQKEGACTFSTSLDIDLLPLKLEDVAFSARPGRRSLLTMKFKATGPTLAQLDLKELRLFLAGDLHLAMQRYMAFFTKLREITVRPAQGGSAMNIPTAKLSPVGFDERESLLPYPERSFPAYRLLQEYFILPEKFLFMDLGGLENWRDRGSGSEFSLEFAFDELAVGELSMRREDFLLHVVPAINLFPQDADPILLDHRLPEYRIKVSGRQGVRQVHSVLSVSGLIHGTMESQEYQPFEMFNPSTEARPVYSLRYELSPLDGAAELNLSVAYQPSRPAQTETLSIKTLCTNGALPETLRAGDVRVPTDSSPVLADFSNIRPPTAQVEPPLGDNVLWRLLSHMYLNYLPMAEPDSLKTMLKLYIFPGSRDKAAVMANTKRIESVRELTVKNARRFMGGHFHRGRQLHMNVDPQGFTGAGDMFLFGSVMDAFLANYASLNSFTRFSLSDSLNKEFFSWPERLGERRMQ